MTPVGLLDRRLQLEARAADVSLDSAAFRRHQGDEPLSHDPTIPIGVHARGADSTERPA